MLRLRTPTGQLKEVPIGCAIELVDAQNRLVMLWLRKTPTTITQLQPGDQEFEQYCRMTRQSSQTATFIEDPTKPPPAILLQ